MSVPVKSKNGSYNNRRRNLIIISLLVVVLVVSLCVFVFVVDNGFGGGVVHVKNEVELVTAIDDVKVGGSAIIALDNDIDAVLTIIIPAYKDITLTSNGHNLFKLIGHAFGTIKVEPGGVLVIDGICVTHIAGVSSCGVDNRGTFTMIDGEISGNSGSGGVSNSGTFTMSGGRIINNVCWTSGGGVQNGGVFTMTGGEITDNRATNSGGGVYSNGTFNWYGGEIYDNTANTYENVHESED